MMRYLILFIVVIINAGCASNIKDNSAPVQEVTNVDLPLSLMKESDNYTLSQILTVDYAGNIYRAMVEVEKLDDKVVFVGMDPFGQVVFSMVIEDEKTELKGDLNGIEPKVIINDYLLTFAPVALLGTELEKQGFHLNEQADGLQRTLFFKDKLVSTISYSSADKYRSTIQLVNNNIGYQVNIQNSEKNVAND